MMILSAHWMWHTNGFSGNLADILIFMASKENCCTYETKPLENSDTLLISNLPINILMVPPEHRIRTQPILNALYNINVPAGKMNDS